MPSSLDSILTPAEIGSLRTRDLSRTTSVVFDVLRATSSIVTALANGAEEVIPVDDIPAALAIRAKRPDVLLAGEREGKRITASLANGVEFDLGNSPREFTAERVQGRSIVMTTTNGSRALHACAASKKVLAASLLNLGATASHLTANPPESLLLICSGTFEQPAFEDILVAGALADLLWSAFSEVSDSARVARSTYLSHRDDLRSAIENSRNGRRLMTDPDLRDDVAWCLRLDTFPSVAALRGDAIVKSGR